MTTTTKYTGSEWHKFCDAVRAAERAMKQIEKTPRKRVERKGSR